MFFDEVDFTKICAALMLVAAICVILKNFGYKGAPVFAALAILVFFSAAAENFAFIKESYSEFISYPEIEKYAKTAVKVIGIGYLSGISSDICRELGEAGIAKCINVSAKFELIFIVTPIISEVLKTAADLIGA